MRSAGFRRTVLLGLAVALLGGCAGQTTGVGSAPPGERDARFVSNEIVLSRAESLRLIRWAQRFRSCVSRRGLRVGAAVPRSKEIDIALLGRPARRTLLAIALACGDGLRGPPARSALQLRTPGFVLFLPRRCLLDPKVSRPKDGVPLTGSRG